MSNDVSEELLKKINKTFTLSYQNSKKIKELLEAIKNRDSDFLKAWDYAEEVGRILADAYMKNLSSDVLPDGKMYYDIASAILNPTLENNYGLISSYVCDSMEVLNKNAGINVKARKPSYSINKTLRLIKKVSDADYFDDVKKYLNEPVITNALSIVDDGARVNADLHYNLGYNPVIKRTASFGCCKWCRGLEGIVEYDPRMDRDIFRRHAYCRCKVIYDPGDSDGKVQDVWSKRWNNNYSYMANDSSINWATNAKKISKEEYKKLRDKINSLGFKVNGLKDFDGDPQLLIDCLEKTQAVRTKYPGLFEGPKQPIISKVIPNGITFSNDDFAVTNGHSIAINSYALRDKEILKNEYAKLAEEGWFVKGTDYKSIVVHELGHVFSNRYHINSLEIAKKILDKEENKIYEYLLTNLSKYSAKRGGVEIISEVFSDYFNNKHPSSFSLKFIEELDKIVLEERS